MPLRRSRVDALDVISYRRRVARLDLRVSSGTYVRSIAEALGGHCAYAAAHRGRPVPGRGGRPGAARPGGRGVGSARTCGRGGSPRREGRSQPRRARAPAASGRARHVRRRPPRPPAGDRAPRSRPGQAPTVVTFDPHPRVAARQRGRAADDARAAARAARGGRDRGGARGRVHLELAQLGPEEFVERVLRPIGADVVVAGADFRFGRGRSRRPRAPATARLRRPRGAARGGRLVDARSGTCSRAGEVERRGAAARPARRGRGNGRRGRRARRHARLPDGEPARRARAARAWVRHLRGRGRRAPSRDLDRHEPALRRRRAADRGVPARLRGRPLRPEAAASSSGSACGTSARSRARTSWSRRSPATWRPRDGRNPRSEPASRVSRAHPCSSGATERP